MSVVVWDGKTLAADRQITSAEMRVTVSKMKRLLDGTLLAWVGSQDGGLVMARWYENGEDVNAWPESQKDKKDWTRLIVVKPDGRVFFYERLGEPINVIETPIAWGSGRDFAMGALAMGADARKAVEVANSLCVSCGMGVEAYDLHIAAFSESAD
jgi:ATP-dependent protease HslVU (ClpYQ) peptidase subunit